MCNGDWRFRRVKAQIVWHQKLWIVGLVVRFMPRYAFFGRSKVFLSLLVKIVKDKDTELPWPCVKINLWIMLWNPIWSWECPPKTRSGALTPRTSNAHVTIDYHTRPSKEIQRTRLSGRTEAFRWVLVFFIGICTALVAFGIDEGVRETRCHICLLTTI